jgi:hypothetical protein
MIDIDAMERRMTRRDDEPLLPPTPDEVREMIAEIRRLGGGEHRRCPKCSSNDLVIIFDQWCNQITNSLSVKCGKCHHSGPIAKTESEAWAKWDGKE